MSLPEGKDKMILHSGVEMTELSGWNLWWLYYEENLLNQLSISNGVLIAFST